MRSPSNHNYLDLNGLDERHEFSTTVQGGKGTNGSLSSAEEGLMHEHADLESSSMRIGIKKTTRVDHISVI